MKFRLTLPPLTQTEILRDSRKAFAKSTAKHRNKKAYQRKEKHGKVIDKP